MGSGIIPNSQALDKFRTLCGLTWTELNARAGVSQRTGTKLRVGRPVAVSTLRRVATVLGVEFAKIVVAGSKRLLAEQRGAAARRGETIGVESCGGIADVGEKGKVRDGRDE